MALPARQAEQDPALRRAASIHARFIEYRITRDRSLRNELVEEHLGVVDHFVRRYRSTGVPVDDLRQVGLLAVLRATERFDPALGVRFATFASRTIEGDVKRYLRDRTWAVRPPRGAQELYLDVRRMQGDLAQDLGRSPTVDQVAQRLGETVDHVLEALEAGGARRAVSFDAPRYPTEDEGESRIPGHTDPAYNDIEMREVVSSVLDALSSRDRQIVELRFYRDMSQPQIAEYIGVSQSYLSRLLRRILEDLRARLDVDP